MTKSINIYGAADFIGMRRAGLLAAQTLDYISQFVAPGVTTEHLDQLCHDFIVSRHATPAPLGYKGYPKSICTSINSVICHGIPNSRPLLEGDILNIDVTVILDGYHGDTSRMFFVGKRIHPKARRLVHAAYECLMAGIEQVIPGNKINAIGAEIERCAAKYGFSVVRDFCGHGIGKSFHENPQIFHFFDPSFKGIMEPGMFFTIEPMINAGSWESKTLDDNWTAVTKDNSLSAQFEHTIAVTQDGYEIFTLSPKNIFFPML